MPDEPLPQIQFASPAPGTGWPYAVLMLIGAGLCGYLALDLYLVLSGYDRAPMADFIFVAALSGLALAFLAAAWAFWYFPWSWARLTVDRRGLEMSVRGWGAMPEVRLAWEEMAQVEVMVLPRHASTLTFRTREGLSKTLRAAALERGLDEVLRGLAEGADAAGFELSGGPVAAPVLGARAWQIEVRR